MLPNVALVVVVNVVCTVLMDVMNNLEASAEVGEEMSYFRRAEMSKASQLLYLGPERGAQQTSLPRPIDQALGKRQPKS